MKAFWTCLGKKDDPFAVNFGRLLKEGGIYKVNCGSETIEIQMDYQDRVNMEAIKISPPISEKNFKQLKKYSSVVLNPYEFRVQDMPVDVLKKWKAQLGEVEGFHKFSLIQAIHFFTTPDSLVELLRTELFPAFFSWYPGSQIFLLSTDPKVNKMLSALRMMGGADKIGQRDLNQVQEIKFANLLSGAQPSGIFQPARYLSIVPALSLPKPFAFLTHRLTNGILFCFETILEDIRTPFSKSGIEFFRAQTQNLFKESKSPNNSFDTFRLIPENFDVSDWLFFFKQFIKYLNAFFRVLLNPARFVKSDNLTWAGLQQYLVWLTIERISDEILLMLTEEQDYLRKLALFRVLDQIAYLGHGESRKQVEIFNKFIIPDDENDDLIAKGLSKYNGVIAKYLQETLVKIRNRLIQEVSSSVYIKSYVDDTSREILVPRSLGMDALDSKDYARKIVREIRNTAHGYSPNDYLIINRGHLPDQLPLLGVMTFLALLASPELFLRKFWD